MQELFYFNNETNIEVDFDVIKTFNNLAKQTFKILNLKQKPFSITLVSEYMIKKINNQYRNKNKITDVISFSFIDNNQSDFMIGDIYICLKKAISQAKKYQHSLKRELSFLFVHGLLHLLGYDHINKEDEVIMFDYQNKILESCKIYR